MPTADRRPPKMRPASTRSRRQRGTPGGAPINRTRICSQASTLIYPCRRGARERIVGCDHTNDDFRTSRISRERQIPPAVMPQIRPPAAKVSFRLLLGLSSSTWPPNASCAVGYGDNHGDGRGAHHGGVRYAVRNGDPNASRGDRPSAPHCVSLYAGRCAPHDVAPHARHGGDPNAGCDRRRPAHRR